jgi:hypothetical protein
MLGPSVSAPNYLSIVDHIQRANAISLEHAARVQRGSAARGRDCDLG